MAVAAALAAIILLWPSGETADCRTVRVSDGDTAIIDCPGWPEWAFRLHGADAPETREGLVALNAKLAFEALLSTPRLFAVVTQVRDAWGRPVVRLMRPDGSDLTCELIRQGHAIEDLRFSRGAYAACAPPRPEPRP